MPSCIFAPPVNCLRNFLKKCRNSIPTYTLKNTSIYIYRKPPTISPGLIYFRKRFLMGLYKGRLIYGGGGAYTWTIFCVSNKQVRHKQVSHKQENKHVLSSDYWVYINSGVLYTVGLYSGGLIFGGAYSRRFTVYAFNYNVNFSVYN